MRTLGRREATERWGCATAPPKKRGPQFSKLMMAGVALSYFWVLIIWTWVVMSTITHEGVDTVGLLTVGATISGATTTLVFGAYAFKAKAENLKKCELSMQSAQDTLAAISSLE